MIKTYRGLLEDGEQDRIRLSTKKGKIGYRILKFQGMPEKPMTLDQEDVLKVYKVIQNSVDGNVDFSDGNLLGVLTCKYMDDSAAAGNPAEVIFEREIFNQDIYITHEDVAAGGRACNYYLEIEAFTLSDNAAAVSTLRDIRLNPQKHA